MKTPFDPEKETTGNIMLIISLNRKNKEVARLQSAVAIYLYENIYLGRWF